jgi:hypothetical protein
LTSIVFVHGLNPTGDPDHSEKTWTHESGTQWPRDLLPERIPHARILIFSYNSNVAWDVSEAGIRQHANTLLDLVQGEKKKTVRRLNEAVFTGSQMLICSEFIFVSFDLHRPFPWGTHH